VIFRGHPGGPPMGGS